jgi:aldose 1-epimerase
LTVEAVGFSNKDMLFTKTTSAGITVEPFGKLPEGEAVSIYSLRNANGIEARVCTYGGILVSLQAPD